VFYPQTTKSKGSIDQLLDVSLPNYEKPIHSIKQLGPVFSFAANTNQGIRRSYNEDRVSIILNADCPKNHDREKWPKVHFFGVFDGHGGQG
jgi:protein phosphatase PTC2/3